MSAIALHNALIIIAFLAVCIMIGCIAGLRCAQKARKDYDRDGRSTYSGWYYHRPYEEEITSSYINERGEVIEGDA